MIKESHGPAIANLRTGRGSHVITKCRPETLSKISSPRIRVIHIYAPEVIKTDAANFRELVQKLTGKPTGRKARKSTTMGLTRRKVGGPSPAESPEFRPCFGNSGQVKEEERFFGGLGEFDRFMEEIGGFSLLPLRSSSHMDIFEDIEILT